MTDTRHRILVVDDLPDWRKTLGGLLKDAGYEVQVAGSSAAALALLRSSHFDLALLETKTTRRD
jgi:CheY-like chemotaxis protein